MKMKSLAMSVFSGLILASLAYIAPAIAEDNSYGGSDQSMPAPSDSGMPTQNNTNPSSDNTSSNNSNPSDMGNIGSVNEAGGPDTATGDDDY